MISLAMRPFFSATKNDTANPFFPARPVRLIYDYINREVSNEMQKKYNTTLTTHPIL
jgi:hypothetical protein